MAEVTVNRTGRQDVVGAAPNISAAAPGLQPRQGLLQQRTPQLSPLPQPVPGYEPRSVIIKKEAKKFLNEPRDKEGPTYWTINRWGAPGKTDLTAGLNEKQIKRAQKHYQPNTVPLPQPDASVFATLNDLETLMRATLGALANFNEDEKMILVKQFRKEEQQARQRGEYSPPGLLNVDQFRHAFKKLSIRVTEDQAIALFIKYSCDAQGLLPYDMFAAKLLSSPARLLALEPEQKGPYKAGKDASFKGKIVYRYCRKPVFPPSTWDGKPALRSAKKPKAGLKLEFVYGYAGHNNTCNNLFWTADFKIVYYLAALGIVYDPVSHTQTFYEGHDNDIRCMALHPNRTTVATGQMANALDGPNADFPYLCVWDTRDTEGTLCRINFPSEGEGSSRYIVAMGFSAGDGQRLVVVTGDNRHTTYIYHWKSKTLICQNMGHNGQPPQVYGVVWNPFTIETDGNGTKIVAPTMFISYGVKHLKIWSLGRDEKTGGENYAMVMGKFARTEVSDVMSAIFINLGTIVTGAVDGSLLVWDVSGTKAGFGTCVQVVQAHGPGVPAPSVHNGLPVLQGVRALCLRGTSNVANELCSGGSDGMVLCWDLSGGSLGRLIKKIELQEVGESVPCSFRSLDCRPGSYDVVAGTSRCEIWEITKEVPEVLVQGHTDDVYGMAFHPKKPHKFATVCDSANVFLWNAKRRQLMAKVSIGVPARAVTFSPNGAHLAVGTNTGEIKVLMVENLSSKVADMSHAKEEISAIKYSPDGSKLAAGSHDNYIYIYDVLQGYKRIATFKGHSSYITHLDWSRDGRIIQSNCGAYEILYSEANTGKQVYQNQRDAQWDTWTCVLGFSVMGVWQKYTDGTDINSLCRSNQLPAFQETDPLVGEGEYVVTASDDGLVRLFNYPCVVEEAPRRTYVGHCSHVMCIRFSPDNMYVMSMGGDDRSAMQWRVLPAAHDDVTVDKPDFAAYQVYQPPKKTAIIMDGGAQQVIPGGGTLGPDIGGGGQGRGPGKQGGGQQSVIGPDGVPIGPGGFAPGEDARKAAEEDAKRRQEEERIKKMNKVQYEITTQTGDIRGAGTDSRVFLVAYGDKQASGQIILENGPENFQRGKKDVFKADLDDLGNVSRVMIGHDASGNCPRWFLDSVSVQNKSANTPPVFFPCGQWFARDYGDGQVVRTLYSGQAAPGVLKSRRYKVTVKTSDVRGAGTDANVYLTLFGEGPDGKPIKSPDLKLENSANNFERAKADVFEVEATVGDLKYIKIGHDNTGVGPGWHLQEVMISSPGIPDTQFIANRWLDTSEGDKQTYVILYPFGQEGAAKAMHKYRIHVFTSDIKGAGTDANVTIILFGSNGLDTGKIKLDSHKNNFERGQEDIFYYDYVDLGDIPEVEIEHDNSGPGPGWHCQEVVVYDTTANKRYAFFCDRWLATDEDDGAIRRRLRVMGVGGENTNYRITTYTSDIRGAGTDANVYCYLCGERDGKEIWGPMQKLDDTKNNFERNQVDTFLLTKHRNLGKLTKMKIGHDNSGPGPGWHLDHVEVVDDGTGEEYYYPCGMWFDKKEGDHLLERVLVVAPKDAKAPMAQYKISVHTSDIKFAGTDANVHIQIMGEMEGKQLSTPVTKLNSSKNDFERGSVDVFTLSLPNVGTMHRIRIGHDNWGLGADWHLKMVEILNVSTGQMGRFYYNGWLSKDEPPYQLEVELNIEGENRPPPCRYTVTTYTSDIRGAGTDANVSIKMFGDKEESPLLPLANSKNNFERGETDEFVVETGDVGKIQKLQIGHDDTGLGAPWHLDHVEILSQATGERTYFIAEKWLDKKLGTSVIVLEPASAPGQKQTYKVSVQTGDKRGGGTDADVSLIMFGDHGTSNEVKLDNSHNNFERNQLDEFTLDLGSQDLGEVKKIEIGFATQQSGGGKIGGLFGKNWHLLSVEVVHLNTGNRAFFLYDDWLTGDKRRVQLVPGKVGLNNTYKVVVRTSDIRGAGTDSNITICIFGNKDGQSLDTGTHKLDDSKDNFERNMTDTFMLKTKDVGQELTRVVVTSDGSGFGAAWHLDQVEVFDTTRAISTVFPCGNWLDPKDPMSLQQTLLPRGVSGEKCGLLQYEITVYTSDIRGAGTDADVFMELWGDKDHTAPLKLDDSHNNFERGMKDMFAPKAPDVGDIQYIIVRKSGGGIGGDWHLQEVEVWHPAMKKRYFFLCNDWLKGACERKLEAGKVPEGGRCTYRITVYTADERGAGTDANVTMVLFGEKGDTGERKLDTSANDFERGQVDTFFFDSPDVGRFQKLVIGHDNSGFGAAWKLSKVEIVNTNSGEQCVFPANRWLDKEHGLSATLTPDRDGDGVGDALEGGLEVEYTVSVYTSDVRGAGTDANVFIEIHGNKGSVGERRIEDKHNNFERGQKDVFKFKASDIGDVEKVIVRHDNWGLGPDWHLQQIEVFSSSTSKTYFFPCNAWLKKEGNDMSGCRKELIAGNPDTSGPTNYRVEVVTSDVRGAGTDADVSLVIYGEKGDTGERNLNNHMRNDFERGQTDVFFLTSPNVGKMHKIKLKSSGSGLGAAWHLARVVITSSATGETLTFPFNNWIDKEHGLEQIIWPDRDGDGVGDVDASFGGTLKYRVNVYTSDLRGAGTDANVSIEIHGDKAFIGATKIENHKNNFERGQKDEFDVSGSDVGEIQKIIIGHDNSGLGAAWHLAQVEVFHPVLQKMYVFPCNEWLQYDSSKGGLENCKRELLVGAAAAAGGLVNFKVLVSTSDLRGAGTDADVFLTIYGPKGDTGERDLEASGNNFERNKVDTFILKGPDIGEADRIRVRSSGTGLGAAWHLKKVDIISSATGQTYTFPFNNWIDQKNGLDHIIYRDGVQGAAVPLEEYRIVVYTSDVRGAGTDANVFIELHGELGSVGQNQLETHGNNFERAQADTFVIKGTDIGDVNKVVIWHDNTGPGPAWHLQQVDVFNPATQRTYYFPCNQWLEKTKEEGDAGCKKVLVAGGSGSDGMCRYQVEVKTSDVRGAGTDANVTLQVFGQKGDTGTQKLDDSKNNFERNMTDTFFFTAPDIGDILSCTVNCDGSGLGAAWHLDYIIVTNAKTGAGAKFVYKNWFDDKNGWTHNLFPEGRVADASMMVPYRITVYTSDLRGAGTSGEVYLSMKGSRGASGETRLENHRDNFSRNQTDVFDITSSDIGAVQEITVRLVAEGIAAIGAAWHFREVEVSNLVTGASYRFVHDAWLEKSKDNPTASVTLKEASSQEAKAAVKMKKWRVTTQTSNIFGAGTDATVAVQIWGPKGILGGSEIPLSNSRNNFERNQVDTFFLDIPKERDCGYPLEKLVIELQSSVTLASDWHLDWIEVTDLMRKHTYKWRCGHWFNSKEGRKKEWSAMAIMQGLSLPLELVEAPPGPDKPPGTAPVSGDLFKIAVVTSDKFAAATDATVCLAFTDVHGQTWQPVFPQTKNMFTRHSTVEFEAASLFPMSELVSCKAWTDPATTSLGDDWHLDHVLITQLPSNRTWLFKFNNWVPKQGAMMTAQVCNDVPLSTLAHERPDVMPVSDQQSLKATPPPLTTVYQTVVYTGNKMGAGTDALITMEVTGTWGHAQHSFDQSKSLFEKNSVDQFLIKIPDCGNLQSLRVWHDGSGFASDWYLAKVTLEAPDHGCKWEAIFDSWIKSGEDKGPVRPLTLISGVPPTGPPPIPEPVSTQQYQQTALPPPLGPGGYSGGMKPGDPGVHPQVLAPDQFNQLPAMQAGDPRLRMSRDNTALPEPKCDWLQYTVPYPQDPRYMLTYYHNSKTGQSTYDKPQEFAQWETQHAAWVTATLRG